MGEVGRNIPGICTCEQRQREVEMLGNFGKADPVPAQESNHGVIEELPIDKHTTIF